MVFSVSVGLSLALACLVVFAIVRTMQPAPSGVFKEAKTPSNIATHPAPPVKIAESGKRKAESAELPPARVASAAERSAATEAGPEGPAQRHAGAGKPAEGPLEAASSGAHFPAASFDRANVSAKPAEVASSAWRMHGNYQARMDNSPALRTSKAAGEAPQADSAGARPVRVALRQGGSSLSSAAAGLIEKQIEALGSHPVVVRLTGENVSNASAPRCDWEVSEQVEVGQTPRSFAATQQQTRKSTIILSLRLRDTRSGKDVSVRFQREVAGGDSNEQALQALVASSVREYLQRTELVSSTESPAESSPSGQNTTAGAKRSPEQTAPSAPPQAPDRKPQE